MTNPRITSQGGPDMFHSASAAGAIIVAGQLVQGNVDNTLNSTPGAHLQSIIPPPLPMTWEEALSESENYCCQMLLQQRGLPLFIPDPQPRPAEHREHGIQIGDVGSVTADGEFEFYFNIFLPAGDAINENRTPAGFIPMDPYDPAEDIRRRDYGAGYYLSTSMVQKVDLDPSVSDFPGGQFEFICNSPRGAVLALPDGAHLLELKKLESMRTYAAKHADSWYKYIKGPKGRELQNGDLCLVTGCEKTRSWGMASYRTVSEQFRLFFKPTTVASATHSPYRWSGILGNPNPSRNKSHDPPTANDRNHTTFIHGWAISLPTGLWGTLFGEVQTLPIVNFNSLFKTPIGSSAAGGSQGSLFSWAFGLLGNGGATGGKRHTGEQEVVLFDLSPSTTIFNPAKLINEYILYKFPQGTGVVMSHDNDWCNVLGDDLDLSLTDFFLRIDKQFAIAEQDGASFLETALTNRTSDHTDRGQAVMHKSQQATGNQATVVHTATTSSLSSLLNDGAGLGAKIACTNCRNQKIECVTSREPQQNSCERCDVRGLDCEYSADDHDDSTMPTQWALWGAAHNGHAETIAQIIESGADIDADSGRALIAAAEDGHVKVVKLLIDASTDINANGGQALYAASQNGHAEVVKLLIEAGTNANGGQALLSLYAAFENKHAEVFKLLTEADATAGQAAHTDEEAVRLRCKLVQTDPSLTKKLASSLHSLALELKGAGQYDTALRAQEEAVELRRKLVEADPFITRDLASSLNNLGVNLSIVGQYEAAIRADEEAVDLCRQLAETDPSVTKELAHSLHNLSVDLNSVGQYEVAIHTVEEAADLCRQLAEMDASVAKDLATFLHTLGMNLHETGQHEAAMHANEEAVELRRKLAEIDPTITKDLADSLHNLGINFSVAGQYEAAIRTAEEAVELFRRLVETDPSVTRNLARSLHSLGIDLHETGQYEAAMGAVTEAVELRRELAEIDPAITKDLADSLHILGDNLRDAGCYGDAARADEEAVALHRKLAETDPSLTSNLAKEAMQLWHRLGDVTDNFGSGLARESPL